MLAGGPGTRMSTSGCRGAGVWQDESTRPQSSWQWMLSTSWTTSILRITLAPWRHRSSDGPM